MKGVNFIFLVEYLSVNLFFLMFFCRSMALDKDSLSHTIDITLGFSFSSIFVVFLDLLCLGAEFLRVLFFSLRNIAPRGFAFASKKIGHGN